MGTGGGLLLARLLLTGDGATRALAGTRVGVGALAADREALAVAQTLVAPDLHLAADVGGHFAAEVALRLVVGVDPVAQLEQVVFGQVLDADVRGDPGPGAGSLRPGTADAVDVGQRDLHPLLTGEVDSDEASHLAVS